MDDWLHSASTAGMRAGERDHQLTGEQPVEDWLRRRMWVERDIDTAAPILIERPSGRWLITFPTRELLERFSTRDYDRIDAVDWTGAQVREWLRGHAPDAGALWRPDHFSEVITLRPERQPVNRITIS